MQSAIHLDIRFSSRFFRAKRAVEDSFVFDFMVSGVLSMVARRAEFVAADVEGKANARGNSCCFWKDEADSEFLSCRFSRARSAKLFFSFVGLFEGSGGVSPTFRRPDIFASLLICSNAFITSASEPALFGGDSDLRERSRSSSSEPTSQGLSAVLLVITRAVVSGVKKGPLAAGFDSATVGISTLDVSSAPIVAPK